MHFSLNSPAFDNGTEIPRRHTCSGEDLSPAFKWQGAPEGTRSFALVCSDPDAPSATFFHWAIYDIPARVREIAEGLPPTASLPGGLRQTLNDFGRSGYAGPCPPRGHGIHHYHFRLFALDVEHLGLAGNARCQQVEPAAQPHCLAIAETVGLFQR